ncbi:hypothetical protein GLOTRDRAFT_125630, partial [Gloeophyllum trabeum ATCC 11539]
MHSHLGLTFGNRNTPVPYPPVQTQQTGPNFVNPSSSVPLDQTLAQLQAKIRALEAQVGAQSTAPPAPPPENTINPMIANPASIQQARMLALSARDDGKKPVVLPPITPGHKRSALSL